MNSVTLVKKMGPLVLACALLPVVATARPEPASGGFFPCFNYAGPPRQVGENVIVTFNISGSSTGTFTSTGIVGTEMDVVHRDGSITLHGSIVFTGSVNGGPEGTMLLTYEGIGNAVTGHETLDRKSTRLNSSHSGESRMPSSA